jgi:CubicO group peptidase (beta-lactamase class C family)
MMNRKIVDFFKYCIGEKIFPGCVAGTLSGGGAGEITAAGHFTYDPASPKVTEDTVYDVASITKAIPTACLALKLIEAGTITTETRCIDFVPEIAGPHREQICVKHLLTHTLDFDLRLSEQRDRSPQDILNAIFTAKLRTPPGTVYNYANATSVLLGLLVERAAGGRRLDTLAEETFFYPLGMKSTGFFPDTAVKKRTAPTEVDPWRGREIRGEVHDESAWALRPAVVAGSAGLFSTVPDLLVFCRMLLNRGEYDGVRFFKRETVALMHANALPPALAAQGCSAALGWELDNKKYMGSTRTTATFGKTGFTGCTVMVDPSRGTGLVLLTNHTYPRRRTEKDTINGVRSRLAEMVL